MRAEARRRGRELGPRDAWADTPVLGRDLLPPPQTRIEVFGDLRTEGPDRGARHVVQADRVS